MEQFVALDVETAESDYSTVCQIGAVRIDVGRECPAVLERFESLIDPEVNCVTEIDPLPETNEWENTYIHGIGPNDVLGKPKFPELYPQLREFLRNDVVLAHGSFDRTALAQCCEKYDLEQIPNPYLDNMRVVRRVNPGKYAKSGYALKKVANDLGIPLDENKLHNALYDAEMAARVFIHITRDSDLNIEGWLKRVEQPINPDSRKSLCKTIPEPNPSGGLLGEVIVFTGTLPVRREEAWQIAADAGCQVTKSLTRKNTIVVVGEQTSAMLKGDKSSKQRKAEKLAAKGHPVRILTDDEFFDLTVSSWRRGTRR